MQALMIQTTLPEQVVWLRKAINLIPADDFSGGCVAKRGGQELMGRHVAVLLRMAPAGRRFCLAF